MSLLYVWSFLLCAVSSVTGWMSGDALHSDCRHIRVWNVPSIHTESVTEANKPFRNTQKAEELFQSATMQPFNFSKSDVLKFYLSFNTILYTVGKKKVELAAVALTDFLWSFQPRLSCDMRLKALGRSSEWTLSSVFALFLRCRLCFYWMQIAAATELQMFSVSLQVGGGCTSLRLCFQSHF